MMGTVDKMVESWDKVMAVYLAMSEVTEAAAWLREVGRDDEVAWNVLLESLGRNEISLAEE